MRIERRHSLPEGTVLSIDLTGKRALVAGVVGVGVVRGAVGGEVVLLKPGNKFADAAALVFIGSHVDRASDNAGAAVKVYGAGDGRIGASGRALGKQGKVDGRSGAIGVEGKNEGGSGVIQEGV